ncbi:MAG TPA: RDD family protein [Candidatus Acidoferrales bacterium]|jgi:uncharacterized RDD family membrane protein YckC|nr:RDD family protein [Candidatus Acidoferrales bacterium]
MFCSKCGASIADGTIFCTSCGQLAATSPSVASATPPVQPTWQPAGAAPAARAPVAYAGFWLRFVAIIIDGIVLGVVLGIPFAVVMTAMGVSFIGVSRPEEMAGPFIGVFALFEIIIFAGQWLYYALMESSSWQATLGKKALGLYVTDMNGQRITFGRATGRYFGKLISGMILLIGYMMAGFTEKKQALHDIMAGCLVLRKL